MENDTLEKKNETFEIGLKGNFGDKKKFEIPEEASKKRKKTLKFETPQIRKLSTLIKTRRQLGNFGRTSIKFFSIL